MKKSRSLVLGASFILSFTAIAHAQVQFTASELAPLPHDIAAGAFSINKDGGIAGQSSKTGDLDTNSARPVLWMPGSTIPLTVPTLPPGTKSGGGGAAFAGAHQINDSDITLGSVYQNGVSLPVYWIRPVQPVVVGLKPGITDYSFHGISSLDVMYGSVTMADGTIAGGFYDIPTRNLVTLPRYAVSGLNGQGHYLRRFVTAGDEGAAPELVQGSKTIPLYLPEGLGWGKLYTFKTNDSDTVVGYGTDQDPSDGTIGSGTTCVWWKGPDFPARAIYVPETGPTDYCSPLAINAGGDILLFTQKMINENDTKTTYWLRLASGEFINVNESIVNNQGVEIGHLYDMNDDRTIVGSGKFSGRSRGLVLKVN